MPSEALPTSPSTQNIAYKALAGIAGLIQNKYALCIIKEISARETEDDDFM